MFKSILIANRGEIACRIIKTAKKMGIETIAIYSDADKDSLHVRKADKSFYIGDSVAKASYLNIETIIAVAKESKAEAIHPGYGFLSENPDFAKACTKENIVFIGPSVSAMESMASKQLAKQLLEDTGVPLTPGYHGINQDKAHLLQEATRIGFPVLLKAANGGGGKGMRAVHSPEEFEQALAGAKRESMASFGDDTMIIEKLIVNPRHVEIQIMADNHGHFVSLFERDCSLQRRHQKIIEEAPAPNLSLTLRHALAKSACDVARAIDYRGAGTVEFLVDGENHFYFMEMNTRLQVEHPVTEMVTGQDLVEWQIKIAANEPLPLTQEEILCKGHAIECRLYAEDPEHGFIPSIGDIDFFKLPTLPGVRIDSGVTLHSRISQYYDPMIAKLIVWGENRLQAILRLQTALSEFAIGPIKSNLPFLQAICHHPAFIDTKLSTDFLTQETIILPKASQKSAILMAASYDFLALTKNEDALTVTAFSWQMHLQSTWHWHYLIENKKIDLEIFPISRDQFNIKFLNDSQNIRAEWQEDKLVLNDGKQKISAWVSKKHNEFNIYLPSGNVQIKSYEWENTNDSSAQTNRQLTAPMPATVAAILKKQGDVIKKGDQLLVLEAMKMEHTIHAPKDGILGEFFYTVGAQVNEGAELLSLLESTQE